jgi:hypothetical protein
LFRQPTRFPKSYFVAEANDVALYDSRGNTSVTAHHVVAALSQGFLHSPTGLASAGAFKEGATDAEPCTIEREKTDSPYDNVAPKDHGGRSIHGPEERR